MTESDPNLEARRFPIIRTMREMLGQAPYPYLTVSLTANVILLNYLVLLQGTTLRAFILMNDKLYAWTSIALALVLAGLIGLALTQVLYGFIKNHRWAGLGRSLLAGALLILSTGCPRCNTSLLPLIGIEYGLAAFPLLGLELKLFAGLLLLSVTIENSRTFDIEVPGEEFMSQEAYTPIAASRLSFKRQLIPAVLTLGAVLTLYLLPYLSSKNGIGTPIWSPSNAVNVAAGGEALEVSTLLEEIFPPQGYTIPASYGDIGPQLLASGAIDLDAFQQIYQQSGHPLTEEQLAILTEGSQSPIVINHENAHFLLNFLWAFGLTNRNPILDEGPIQTHSEGDIGRFASTGGWTIGQKPATELFSSTPILELSSIQQESVENVAAAVYRPCCNNPTVFPDCNHGMAMLGLLQLMAAKGATETEMHDATKYVNAYWFPQQVFEIAIYLKAVEGVDFADIDPRRIVGSTFSSGSGFRSVHQWLEENELLKRAPSRGGSCGVS